MNAAVRAAIEQRIAEVNGQIEQETQVLTSLESQMFNLQTEIDRSAASLDLKESERDQLTAALPEEVEDE